MTLARRVDGRVEDLAGPVEFRVVRVLEGSLDGTPPTDTSDYMRRVAELQRKVSAAGDAVDLAFERLDLLDRALDRSTVHPGTLDRELETLRQRLFDLDERLSGNRSVSRYGHPQTPTVARRLRIAAITDGQSDYGPTATHRRSFAIAVELFAAIEPELHELLEVALPELEAEADAAGVPWSPGRQLPE